VDLVISCLGLHWTNDLPGAMIQVNFLIPLICFLLLSQKHYATNISFITLLMSFFHLCQSMLALKPDGLFLAAILGGETLKSLFLYILLEFYLEHQYMFPPFL
jgi:NADH dehydrogenase [ubiquinone] 1 alpha subcomplex assembly factor 5